MMARGGSVIQGVTDASGGFATLHEVARLISSSLELDEVLDRVMDAVVAVTGAERGIVLLEDAAGTLVPAAARSLQKEDLDRRESGVSRSLCERVFRTGRAEVVGDALEDARTAVAESVVALRLRSVLCAPLQLRGRTTGVVYLDHRQERGRFGQRQLSLLEAVGEQAAVAIENARLYEEARRRAREIADLKAYQDDVLRSVGTGIAGLDLAGRVVSLNRAAEELLGTTIGDAAGRSYAEVFGAEIAGPLLSPLAAAGLGRGGRAFHVSRPPRTPLPGQTPAAHSEQHLRCAVEPLRDGAGAICGLIVTLEDETRRIVAERARADADRSRERLEAELRLAREIQLALLPKTLPTVDGWTLAAHYSPARLVGGDFYDVIPLDGGGVFALVIGDVSGKGVPAALMMASTRTAVRAAARGAGGPAALLAEVNAQLWSDMPRRTFVTCLCVVVDTRSGAIRFASAGHLPPLVRRGPTGAVDELAAAGLPLGIEPDARYSEAEAHLRAGDALLLYSDGVVEAHDAAGRMLGFDGLATALGTRGDGSPIDAALARLAAHAIGEQEDDVTLLSLARRDPAAPPGGAGG
ncbi:MAG TPA: SpoIIE family protein phosphatase [Chloroflexota bacterium]|nr:SpoIIE family protein phosphatase [Chloroflexota bacterium]